MAIEYRNGAVILDGHQPFAGIFPKFLHLEVDGSAKTAVKHTLESSIVLRNMGHNVEGPVARGEYLFTGRYTPYKHQVTTVDFLTTAPRAFVLNDMGTGKSSAVLWAFDYLRKAGKLSRMLVVSPLSTMESVWANETFTTCPHMACSVIHGSAERRVRLLEDGSPVCVINHDGIKTGAVLNAIKKSNFDLIVVDEFTAFKDHKTDRYKSLKSMLGDKSMWMLSGSPAPQAPTDVWAPCRLVNPAGTPTSFVMFRDATMKQTTRFKWKPKPNAEEVLSSVMRPAIRFSKKDCLDLPPIVPVYRKAELTPLQTTMLKQLASKWTTEAAGAKITASNAAIRIGKVFQIAQGAVITNDGGVVELDAGPREAALLDFVRESNSKTIVFASYTAVINSVAYALSKHFSCGVIDGSVSSSQRAALIDEFQNGGLHTLVLHPRTASHGLTLTAASTSVWYGPTFSVESYIQANARMNRPGQTLSMTLGHIYATALEMEWYTNLANGGITNDRLLEIYEQIIGGSFD